MGGHAGQVDVFTLKFREIRDQFTADKAANIEISVVRVAGDIANLRGDLTDHGSWRTQLLYFLLT
jgi:hypothetical protein